MNKGIAMEQVATILIILIAVTAVIIFFMTQFSGLSSGFGTIGGVAQNGTGTLNATAPGFFQNLTS